jgi:hypothetical protein
MVPSNAHFKRRCISAFLGSLLAGNLAFPVKHGRTTINTNLQAGPDACALAKTRNDGPADIDGRIQGLLSTLYESPMHAVINRRAGLLTPGLARSTLDFMGVNLR